MALLEIEKPRGAGRPTLRAPGRGAGAAAWESWLFRAALAVIALHVVDDSFLQPPAGTTAGDHLVSGVVPLLVLGLAAWAHPRLRGVTQGALSAGLGLLGVAAGVEALYYTTTVGPSGDDFTGLLAVPAGLLLLGLAPVTLWRTRRRDGRRAWRYGRRVLVVAAAYVAFGVLVLPIGFAYVITHTGRAEVPPNRLGVPYEDVRFRTADGLELEGWYVRSRNGAAVIAFPGRKGPQRQTRMLAAHGYGVLLFDRRGEGRSQGAPSAVGWGGDRDIQAAVVFLRRRADVDPERIGGIGLSVGGELMLEAAAKTPGLAAVVSEGAGARSYSEEVDEAVPARDRLLFVPATAVKTAAVAVFADRLPPQDLRDLVPRIAPRPVLLVAAPNSKHGEELNRRYVRAAGPTATLWEIPESGHVDGIAARPAEYERRVVGFFDRALGPGRGAR
jgi:dienelactone hydrolase